MPTRCSRRESVEVSKYDPEVGEIVYRACAYCGERDPAVLHPIDPYRYVCEQCAPPHTDDSGRAIERQQAAIRAVNRKMDRGRR